MWSAAIMNRCYRSSCLFLLVPASLQGSACAVLYDFSSTDAQGGTSSITSADSTSRSSASSATPASTQNQTSNTAGPTSAQNVTASEVTTLQSSATGPAGPCAEDVDSDYRACILSGEPAVYFPLDNSLEPVIPASSKLFSNVDSYFEETGPRGSCLRLATPGMVSITESGLEGMIGNTEAFSIEFWVKVEVPKTPILFAFRNTAAASNVLFNTKPTTGVIRLVRDWGPQATTITTAVEGLADQWLHLVGTYSNPDLRLYVNGAVVSSGISSMPLPTEGWNPAFSLGEAGGNGGRLLQGWVDELAIYRRALNPDEVAAHYQKGKM